MTKTALQFTATDQDFTQPYSAREILHCLQNIRYEELPEYVREYFEKEFAKQVQDPGVQQMLNTLRIHFQPRG